MAYDEKLATQIRAILARDEGVVEKKMFGGIGFLVNGNMACGVHKDQLVVRVGPEAYEQALREANISIFNITGRPMTGWVMVAPEGIITTDALKTWVMKGIDFSLTLPHT